MVPRCSRQPEQQGPAPVHGKRSLAAWSRWPALRPCRWAQRIPPSSAITDPRPLQEPSFAHTRKHSLPLLEKVVAPSRSSVMVTGDVPCVPPLRALEPPGTMPHLPSQESRQGLGHVRWSRASAGPRASCRETTGPASSPVSSARMPPEAQGWGRGQWPQQAPTISQVGSGLGKHGQRARLGWLVLLCPCPSAPRGQLAGQVLLSPRKTPSWATKGQNNPETTSE